MKKEKKIKVAFRPDEEGKMDDVVINGGITMFHMEQMDNNAWWLACDLENGEMVSFRLNAEEDGITLYVDDFPKGVEYENGSMKENYKRPLLEIIEKGKVIKKIYEKNV